MLIKNKMQKWQLSLNKSVSYVDFEWAYFSPLLICSLVDIFLGSMDLRVME